jgi:hypothetical protein
MVFASQTHPAFVFVHDVDDNGESQSKSREFKTMPRYNDRKLGLTIETLEGRELQSGVISPAVTPNAALINQNTPQINATITGQSYHGAVGFFGQ